MERSVRGLYQHMQVIPERLTRRGLLRLSLLRIRINCISVFPLLKIRIHVFENVCKQFEAKLLFVKLEI